MAFLNNENAALSSQDIKVHVFDGVQLTVTDGTTHTIKNVESMSYDNDEVEVPKWVADAVLAEMVALHKSTHEPREAVFEGVGVFGEGCGELEVDLDD